MLIQTHGNMVTPDEAVGEILWSHTWLERNGALSPGSVVVEFDWPSQRSPTKQQARHQRERPPRLCRRLSPRAIRTGIPDGEPRLPVGAELWRTRRTRRPPPIGRRRRLDSHMPRPAGAPRAMPLRSRPCTPFSSKRPRTTIGSIPTSDSTGLSRRAGRSRTSTTARTKLFAITP